MPQSPRTGLLQKAQAALAAFEATPANWQLTGDNMMDSKYTTVVTLPFDASLRMQAEKDIVRHMLLDNIERRGFQSTGVGFDFTDDSHLKVSVNPYMFVGNLAGEPGKAPDTELDGEVAIIRERLQKGQAISFQKDEEAVVQPRAQDNKEALQQLSDAIGAGWEKKPKGTYDKWVTTTHGEAGGEFFFPEVVQNLNIIAGTPLITYVPKPDGGVQTEPESGRLLKQEISVKQENYNKLARIIGIPPMEIAVSTPHPRAPAPTPSPFPDM